MQIFTGFDGDDDDFKNCGGCTCIWTYRSPMAPFGVWHHQDIAPVLPVAIAGWQY
ncbi:hypothetical protein JNB11_00695 [Kocuria palustris]|nr:hypothetical protein [Kocuria palustris]